MLHLRAGRGASWYWYPQTYPNWIRELIWKPISDWIRIQYGYEYFSGAKYGYRYAVKYLDTDKYIQSMRLIYLFLKLIYFQFANFHKYNKILCILYDIIFNAQSPTYLLLLLVTDNYLQIPVIKFIFLTQLFLFINKLRTWIWHLSIDQLST